jgi:RNA polymerase sigma factor (sigma-70 family)
MALLTSHTPGPTPPEGTDHEPSPTSPSQTLFLINEAGTGDQHAFRKLYRKNRAWLRTSAALLIGEQLAHVEVEDLLQDTFAYAFRKIQNGEFSLAHTEGAFRHYLGAVLRHKAIDAARRAKAKKRGEGREKAMRDLYTSTVIELGIQSPDATPSQQLQGAELASAVSEAIAKLTDLERRILHYRLVCHMPYEKILENLKADDENAAPGEQDRPAPTKLGTVKSMFSRARKKLLDTLKGSGLVGE